MKINLKIQFNNVFMLSVVILGVFLLFGQVSANALADNDDNYLELEREIINQLNQERVDHDLAALQFNNILKKAARLKLNDMVTKKYFLHTSPEGKDPWHWFEQAGYDYKFAGENLATKFITASEVHEAWMKSKTHRENILFPDYKDVAVVVGENIGGELVAVELFGQKVGDNGVKMSGMILPTMKGLDENRVVKNNEGIDDNNRQDENILATSSTSIVQHKMIFGGMDRFSKYNISFSNALLLLIGGACFILVINVWILEKEEEKIILELKKVS